MKKTILLVIALVCLFALSDISNAQTYKAPKIIYGFTLNGNLANLDAYGTDFTFSGLRNYGMIYGRGVSAHVKFGLGETKKNRITVSATWDAMVNDNGDTKIPFFTINPSGPATFYHFWSGAVGYEYGFNARCNTKQYLGAALTGTYIVHGEGSVYPAFDNTFRMGLMFNGGFEFVLNKSKTVGLALGAKWHIPNIFFQENGVGKLNDGTGSPGAGFWRKMGIISLTAGLNFYSGVK